MNEINWQISIGDPTFLGWLTVIAYFYSVLLAFKIAFYAENIFASEFIKKQKSFWLILGLVMLFLGINKQLDLHTLLTAIGKYYAHQDGWYQHRREIQFYVIGGLLISMISLLLLFMHKMKGILMTNMFAIIGLAIILIFIIIRATSFHHIDFFMNISIFNIGLYRILEISGISTVVAFALYLLKKGNKGELKLN
jgi:hypothetical protein